MAFIGRQYRIAVESRWTFAQAQSVYRTARRNCFYAIDIAFPYRYHAALFAPIIYSDKSHSNLAKTSYIQQFVRHIDYSAPA